MIPVEIIALSLIVLATIKMIVLLVKPNAWMSFARGIYKKPKLLQFVAFVLAAIVLYYLIGSGLTIVDIFAVAVFVALLFAIGLAPEADHFIKKCQTMIKKGTLWRQYWLYTLLWIVLMIWGVKELFF